MQPAAVVGEVAVYDQADEEQVAPVFNHLADDQTARFMADFYRAALARTQRDWLVRLRQEKGLDAAVYLVGPFQLNFQGQP